MLLSDAIDRYAADRRVKGYAKSTVEAEQRTLRQLLAAVGNIQTHNLNPNHIDVFYSKHPSWEPGTMNLKKAHLQAFFKWARARSHMARNSDPLEGLRNQPVPDNNFAIIPVEQFEEVLDLASNPRDRAVVAIGLYLFTRISETAALRWRDIDFQKKTINVYRKKTKKLDVLPMCKELEHELRRWKFEYSRLAGEVVRPEWLVCPTFSTPRWTGRKGEKGKLYLVEAGAIQPLKEVKRLTDQVKKVLARLGIDDRKEGGHTLRRSGATALYHELSKRGHDRAIRLCQAMLGHASIRTTEIYLALDLDRKARNDLLAGKPMFGTQAGGKVIDLEGGNDGQEDAGAL